MFEFSQFLGVLKGALYKVKKIKKIELLMGYEYFDLSTNLLLLLVL